MFHAEPTVEARSELLMQSDYTVQDDQEIFGTVDDYLPIGARIRVLGSRTRLEMCSSTVDHEILCFQGL
jgi:hypothetical protein